MIRVVCAFSVGIIAALVFPHITHLYTGILLLAAGYITYAILFFVWRKSAWGSLAGILGLSVVAIAGWVKTFIFMDAHNAHHLINYKDAIEYYVAVVTKPGEKKKNTWRYEMSVQRVNNGKKWTAVTGKMLIYITGGNLPHAPFSYGDELLITGSPKIVESPKNPHAFNFKRFLKFKNIYHQHFVARQKTLLIASAQRKDIKYYAYAARSWAMHKLKTYLSGEHTQAVALALTLGVSDGIDNTLRQAYAASGAMHVLAVSGLHVGIIYGIIAFALIPLRSVSWGRWVIAFISITILWGYAFLTGLSPSVLRAVTMFSFVALAGLLGRNTNIYNTLAGSAFLLLLFNPYIIVSVGFQLSYLAVFGIVTLYKPLYLLLEPRLTFLDWVWRITCVSIAAQLATFALGLFYFNQLPVYFFVSNLFVLPGAMVVLIGSILVIFVSLLPPLAAIAGTVLQWFIGLLNKGVFVIESLPMSVVDNIYITPLQCLSLMMIVIFLVLLLRNKKYTYLLMMTTCVVVFAASRWVYFYNEVLQKRLVVYAVPGHTGVEWIEEGKSYFYSDEQLANNRESLRFNILPNRLFCNVSNQNVRYHNINNSGDVVAFYRGGMLIVIVNKPIRSWPAKLPIDYLIIGENAFRSFRDIERIFQFDRLILSTSNSKKYCERIVQEGRKTLIYSVPHQGAYVQYL